MNNYVPGEPIDPDMPRKVWAIHEQLARRPVVPDWPQLPSDAIYDLTYEIDVTDQTPRKRI
jgi:hypothetical protein